jgi:rubrerythrin
MFQKTMRTKENTEYSLADLLQQGYWFCVHCDRIVALGDETESPAKCPRCSKITAIWQKPVSLTPSQN